MTRAKNWSRRIARSRWGDAALGFASFSETVIVPIPMELVLMPHMQANRDRLWWLASVALLGCLAGAVLGYAVGLLLFESVGRWALETFGWQEDFATFRRWFDAYGFWAIVAIGVVPIPFQTAMLLAGVTQYPFVLFVAAAVLARGLRYYGLAALVALFGAYAEALWRRHSRPLGFGLTLSAAAGLAALLLLAGSPQ